MRHGKVVLAWVLQVVLAAMFLAVGIQKFVSPTWPRMFARWGYPPGFHLLIGAAEALGALALLAPPTAALASLLLLLIMAGAAGTHLVHGDLAQRAVQLVVMSAMLAAVAGLRWPAWWHKRAGPPQAQP
jgi:uncharacterized membrane protein YphA (DoxX/SURF4 family)